MDKKGRKTRVSDEKGLSQPLWDCRDPEIVNRNVVIREQWNRDGMRVEWKWNDSLVVAWIARRSPNVNEKVFRSPNFGVEILMSSDILFGQV